MRKSDFPYSPQSIVSAPYGVLMLRNTRRHLQRHPVHQQRQFPSWTVLLIFPTSLSTVCRYQTALTVLLTRQLRRPLLAAMETTVSRSYTTTSYFRLCTCCYYCLSMTTMTTINSYDYCSLLLTTTRSTR